jgi:putative chitinase
MISSQQIQNLAPWLDRNISGKNQELIRLLAYKDALNKAMQDGDINTPLRQAHFLAQCATETYGFRHLTESMFYTDALNLLKTFPNEVHSMEDASDLIKAGPQAIANRVYAERLGNGDEDSGDGWRYRGRGFLQITGKYNYKMIGKQIGMDLVNHPEILEDPEQAAQAAMKFWNFHGCSQDADADDLNGVTKEINPSLEGIDDRRWWLIKIKKVLGGAA